MLIIHFQTKLVFVKCSNSANKKKILFLAGQYLIKFAQLPDFREIPERFQELNPYSAFSQFPQQVESAQAFVLSQHSLQHFVESSQALVSEQHSVFSVASAFLQLLQQEQEVAAARRATAARVINTFFIVPIKI